VSAILHRSVKLADTEDVKVFRRIELNFSLLTFASQQDATLWLLGHDVHGKKRTFGPVNFETSRGMLYSKGIVKLYQDVPFTWLFKKICGLRGNGFDGGCSPPNPAPLAAAGVRGEQ